MTNAIANLNKDKSYTFLKILVAGNRRNDMKINALTDDQWDTVLINVTIGNRHSTNGGWRRNYTIGKNMNA